MEYWSLKKRTSIAARSFRFSQFGGFESNCRQR